MSNVNSQPDKLVSLVNQDEIDLFELARIFWQNKKLIFGTMTVSILLSSVISITLPKTYVAEASILPMSSSDPGAALAAGLSAQLGPMANMLGVMSSNKSADLTEILNSRSMANRVITAYNLDKEMDGWKHRSELTSKLKKMTTIVPPSLKSKILTIKVSAPTAPLAEKIANAYVLELKSMLDEIGYHNATRHRAFIENKLRETEASLSKSEEALTKFQTSNQIASLPDTVVASIRSLSDLEAQRISATVEIQGTNEALQEVRSRINAFQTSPEMLTQLEIKRNTLAAQEAALEKAQKNYLDKLTTLPPKAMALARLQRDVQVQNAIYLALTQQYQSALINESKDSDSFLPLDRAETPLKPSNPRILVNIIFGCIIGLVAGCFAAIFRNAIKSRITSPLQ